MKSLFDAPESAYMPPKFWAKMVREGDAIQTGGRQLHGSMDAAAILAPYFEGLPQEHMVCLALSAKSDVLGMTTVSIGTIDSCLIDLPSIFRFGILSAAASLIIAHNHPSGDPRPSLEDIAVTKRAKEAGNLMGIPVIDHLVIGAGGQYQSAI